VGAEAEVDAAAEAEVVGRVPVDAEGVGVVVASEITVGRAVEQQDPIAGRDLGALHDMGRQHGPEEALDGGVVTQRLLDGARDQIGAGAQLVPHGGLGRERVQDVAEQVGRGLVPGDQQQETEPEDLRVVQRAFLAGLDETAEEVAPRGPSAFLDQRRQIPLQ
jgi:hypothetical protein